MLSPAPLNARGPSIVTVEQQREAIQRLHCGATGFIAIRPSRQACIEQ
jgi:hypothetical protein